MSKYLEAFFRHRTAMVGLMAVTMAISVTVIFLQPRTYQATAHVWFERSPVTDASVNTYLTPADQASAVFRELLDTRDFDVKVGRSGPLANYIDQTGRIPTADPVTPFIHTLEGKSAPTGTLRQRLIDDGIQLLLRKNVLVEPTGPQVVALTFTYEDPVVAAGTLKALIDQFTLQVQSTANHDAQATLDFYDAQVKSQAKDVEAADAAVARYLVAHPELRGQNTPPDATLAGLQQVDDLARQRFASLSQKLDQARLDVASQAQPGSGGFRVIDAPEPPTSASGTLKTLLIGAGGGLGGGLFVIMIALFLIVAADDTVTSAGDFAGRLGVRVVGELPMLGAKAQPLRGRRRAQRAPTETT